MPLSHVSLPTGGPSHFQAMRDFYLAILQPLGYTVFKEDVPRFCGMMHPSCGPDFWLHCSGGDGDGLTPVDKTLSADDNRKMLGGPRTHVAFQAGSKRQVDEWFRNAVKAGGIPNGAPGERPEYSKGYYAAFVLDPLGNNVEAVYFNPWWLQMMKAAPGVVAVVFGAVAGHFALRYAKTAGWA